MDQSALVGPVASYQYTGTSLANGFMTRTAGVGTLILTLQYSNDGGVTWVDFYGVAGAASFNSNFGTNTATTLDYTMYRAVAYNSDGATEGTIDNGYLMSFFYTPRNVTISYA